MIALIATLGMVLGAGTVSAHAAVVPGKVTGLKVKFHKTDATFSWDTASNARQYAVVLEPRGGRGPFPPTVVTYATSVNISYKLFPGYKTNESGWEFVVAGENSAGAGKSATAKSGVRVSASGGKLTTSDKTAIAKKIMSCLNQGAAAALSTGAVLGLIDLVAIWIPGVGEVGAAGVALAMGGAYVTVTVQCMVKS